MPELNKTTMFPAKLEQLRALSGFVEGFCGEAGLGNDDCLRVTLVLEELFTNTVRHGHRGDSEAPVWVTLATHPAGGLNVVYEDCAPPFNPYGKLPLWAPDETLRSRKIGGLGLLLTHRLAQSRDYAYLFGRNCVRLVFVTG